MVEYLVFVDSGASAGGSRSNLTCICNKVVFLDPIKSNNLSLDLLLMGERVLLQKNLTTKLASILMCATFSMRRGAMRREIKVW